VLEVHCPSAPSQQQQHQQQQQQQQPQLHQTWRLDLPCMQQRELCMAHRMQGLPGASAKGAGAYQQQQGQQQQQQQQ
jgi:hypothetical protein